MPRLALRDGRNRPTSSPLYSIFPSTRRSMPISVFMSVVLPTPLRTYNSKYLIIFYLKGKVLNNPCAPIAGRTFRLRLVAPVRSAYLPNFTVIALLIQNYIQIFPK